MRITTRIATLNDMSLIYALYREAMKDYIERIWGWDESWQINDFTKTFESVTTHVIENDAEFSGYFQLELGKHSDYLRMFIVSPRMRCAGIGQQLLNNILNTSHKNGRKLILRVFKINTDAIRFYVRNGLKITGEEDKFYLMENDSYPVINIAT